MPESLCSTCGTKLDAGSLCPKCKVAAITTPAHAADARLPMPTPAANGAFREGLPTFEQAPLPSIRKDLPGVFRRIMPYLVVVCVIATVICLLVPVVERARHGAGLSQTINNMKQIVLACHAYHDVKKRLPTPTMIIADGLEVALSWRVAVLPYLDDGPLGNAFDTSVGWKDPKNFPLSEQMVPLYVCVYRDGSSTTRTRFLQFTGPDTLYPKNASVKLTDIADGSSTTFLFAEADQRVHWPRPADMAIQADQPLPLPEDSFYACLADGTVRFISREKTSDTILRQLMHPNDGQPGRDWDQ